MIVVKVKFIINQKTGKESNIIFVNYWYTFTAHLYIYMIIIH